MEPTAVSEINFDGLVGPTHNYSGLSSGNLASMGSLGQVSNPRAAALQGLAKMRLLQKLGVPQAILPPHARPELNFARRLGFSGSDAQIVAELHKTHPRLLARLFSASSMWVANSGVFSPSQDTEDGKVHITPANLVSKLHRSLEPRFTFKLFKTIFKGSCFEVHPPLPAHPVYGDEGAANHERLFTATGGVELFVWGREAFGQERLGRFVARQTDAASEAVARNHRLRQAQLVFAQQSARAIDAGAFHNDVVAVAHGSTLLFHEAAFEDTAEVLSELRTKLLAFENTELKAVEITHHDLPLEKAISSYLFNSQLVTTSTGQTLLLAPIECEEDPVVCGLLQSLPSLHSGHASPFNTVQFVNLKESMKNGGGPACLRVRVTLTDAERAQVHPGVFLNSSRLDALEAWVVKHYRDRLSAADFADPKLLTEVNTALTELEQILDLRGLYELS